MLRADQETALGWTDRTYAGPLASGEQECSWFGSAGIAVVTVSTKPFNPEQFRERTGAAEVDASGRRAFQFARGTTCSVSVLLGTARTLHVAVDGVTDDDIARSCDAAMATATAVLENLG